MMKRTRLCSKIWAAAAAGVLFGINLSLAANGAWNGTQDAYWTNSANWSAAPYPSGAETASFTNSGNSQTSINLSGLASISNITFDTADVAAYTLGAGAANSQTGIMRDNGTFRITGTAANSQTFNGAVQLGLDTANASYSFRNDSANRTLTFNNVSGTAGGTKTLNIDGTGNIAVLGNLTKSGSSLNLNDNSTATLTLSGGNNQINMLSINGANGVISLSSGTTTFNNGGGSGILAGQDCTINGPGSIVLSTAGGNNHADNGVNTNKTVTINAKLTGATGFEYWHGSYWYGTFVLNGLNDYTLSTVINVAGTVQFATLANRGVACNLGAGTNLVLNAVGARFRYTGTGDTSDRIVDVQVGGIIEQAGSGNLKFTSATQSTSGGGKTLVLQGSNTGSGEFSGAIVNGSGTVALTKDGTGTWTLSAANSYSGVTAVNNGTLVLSGALGAAASSTGYAVTNGATLSLYNASGANATNRLSDTATLTLNGGTLSFTNDGSAADFLENAGTLAVNLGASTVAATPAAGGQASTLRFSAITRTPGATVNFTGTGLGESGQNRIFIAGQPSGLIGSWATVNGTGVAAYDSTKGVYALGVTYTDIKAEGPASVIPDSAAAFARINLPGEFGPITLAGDWTNSINLVLQNTPTNSTVATRDGETNKTLLTSGLLIGAGKASLTVGQSEGDGSLAALTPGGGILLENNNPDALLTVNAKVVNNASASALSKSGAGKALLTGSNSYSGATAIYEGTLAFGGGSTQTIAGVISGAGALAKEGTGYLTLTAANTYAGLTTVSNGTLLVKNNAALGASTLGTVIADGATLDIGGSATAQAMNLNAEQITVSGAGVNGRGAIINGSNISQYQALRLVTLAGNTTFGGEQSGGRWDIRNTSGTATFLMNGFAVTKVGTNQVGLTSVGVTPGATGAIDIKEGNFTVEVSTTMGGSAANLMTVRSGALFDIYDMASPIAWSLVMEDNSRFYARSGNATNRNIWSGPVTLNGRAVFDAGGAFSDTLSGDISGTGSVVKATATSTTYFTGTNNTYGGATTISNGTLYAKTAGSLPGYNTGKLTVLGGAALAVNSSNGTSGWTAEQISDLNAASAFLGNNAFLNIDTTNANLTIPYNLTRLMGLNKLGDGTLTLAGNNTTTGQVLVSRGVLDIAGPSSHFIGQLTIGNAAVFMTNAAPVCVYLTNNTTYVGNNSSDLGSLTVAGNAALGSALPGYNTGGWQTLVVGQSGKGVLTLKDNALVTNKLFIGNNGGSAGAVYQSGNSVMHNWGGAGNDSRMGANGYGYYELSGGTLTNNGYTQVGWGPAGVGILVQTGGKLLQGTVYGGNLSISRGGTGVVYLAGGTLASSAGLDVGNSSENSTTRGFADFTMAPAANSAYFAGNILMADRTNMFATVNLNGGALTANQITKSSSRTGSVAIVNFNGGTFRARAAGYLFGTGVNAPDAVNIYAGGATFDTTNLDCTLTSGLLAPVGSGVSGIALAPRGGYIGPPFVTVSGSGTGATAIAQFDSASGFVNGITVTCPGYGYTSAPTVTLSGGGTNVHLAATASLAPNVSGGLTKLGSGMLVLNATNTYAGVTTVSNGMLRVGVRAALPAGTDINVAGGILDLGGFSLTNGAIKATGGAIVNGSLSGASFIKSGNGTLTLSTPVATPAPIVISSGVVKLQGVQPGLYEGVLPTADNTASNNPNTSVRLTTRAANGAWTSSAASGGIWTDQTTYIYSGYLWNRAATNVTWNFVENFDDTVRLKIDGTTVINGGGGWNVPTLTTNMFTPGAHAFELRLGQGAGGVGGPNPVSAWWNTLAFSFGYDPLGRGETNVANFAVMTDPGDGSLFSLTAAGSTTNLFDTASSVEVAAGAVLDLDTYYQSLANLSGAGTVSNGTLAVTGTLAPGGTNSIGTLTAATSLTLSGTLLADVAANGAGDMLAVQGNLSLEPSSVLTIANPGQLDHQQIYTLATVTGTRTGTFGSNNLPSSHWRIVFGADGTVKLIFVSGTVLMLK